MTMNDVNTQTPIGGAMAKSPPASARDGRGGFDP